MRRILFPTLIISAVASSAWAQASQETPPDLTVIKADLERIKGDLESVKNQLGQVLRQLSQRPAQGGVGTSAPVHWEMHDVLFRGQKAPAPSQLDEQARVVGLNKAKFDECLSSGRYAAMVQRGLAEGAVVGAQGTPSFVVGKTKGNDVVDGTPIRGAQSLEVFRRIIEQKLAEQ